MTSTLPDATWQQLDPAAARLRDRTKLRLALSAVLILALVTAGVGLWPFGADAPQLTIHRGNGVYYEFGSTHNFILNPGAVPTVHVSQTLGLTNDSSYPVVILGVGADVPGLLLERVWIGDMVLMDTNVHNAAYRLSPGDSVSVKQYYWVRDCVIPPTDAAIPIPVRVFHRSGDHTVDLPLAPLRIDGDGGLGVTDQKDPGRIQWQRILVDAGCGRIPPWN